MSTDSLSFIVDIQPCSISYGPTSVNRSAVALDLGLTFNWTSQCPELVVHHIYGRQNPETERSGRLEASWADMVQGNGTTSFLRSATEEAFGYQYHQLSDVQKDILWRPEQEGLREQLAEQTLSMIMSEIVLDLLNGQDGNEVPDLDVLAFDEDDLRDFESAGIYTEANYWRRARSTVDDQMTDAVRRLHARTD